MAQRYRASPARSAAHQISDNLNQVQIDLISLHLITSDLHCA